MLCKMWKIILGCTILMTGISSSEGADSKVVNTTYGQVRGYKDSTTDIYEFHSIPYAKAPTGTNRFQAPLAPTAWSDTLEAVDKGIICPQLQNTTYGVNSEKKTMQEDCLILNVYCPNTDETNLPVIVYCSGGAYVYGFGNMLTPKNLVASHNVIIVTFNYRVGAHGFLSLGTSNIPGNAGMKDHVAAFRWVQSNIGNFGGDPAKVTAAGYGSGGTAAALMMVSKMSSGLFTKIIQESGGIGDPYDLQMNPIDNAKEYAELLGYSNGKNCTALEEFYLNLSMDDLQSGNVLSRRDSSVLMSPCVEVDVGQDEMFLDTNPITSLENGNFTIMPMLVGFTNMEGLLLQQNFDVYKDEMNANFSNFLPAYLKFKDAEEKSKIASQIKQYYFGDEDVSSSNILKYIDYFSDTTFVCPCIKTVKTILAASNENLYLFNYTFVDEDSTPVVKYTDVRGAQHIAETYAVLDGVNITNQNESGISTKLENWKTMIRQAWYNFSLSGVPTTTDFSTWKPATSSNIAIMTLNESPVLGVLDACSYLFSLFDPYYQERSAPTCS